MAIPKDVLAARLGEPVPERDPGWDWLDKTLDWISHEPWWEYRRLDPRRDDRLNASEMGIVMGGDRLKIHELWQVKRRLIPKPDLSKEWSIIVGQVLEGPMLARYELRAGALVHRRQESVVHPEHDWFGCTLDGWDTTLKCPVECKAVGGREPLEVILERYQPQMQSQCAITGAAQCALVVSFGTQEPIIEYIPRDDEYVAELILRGRQFWQYVETGVSPVDMPAIAAPPLAIKSYDMTHNNLWASEAVTWLQTKASADACKDAEKVLKSLVPSDGRKAYGHGIYIVRDRAGRLSLRRAKQ